MSTEQLQPTGITKSDHLSSWIYDTIRPFVKGSVLELGSRTGNMTDYFVADQVRLRVSDPDRQYCIRLKEKFQDNDMIASIHRVDPENERFELDYSPYLGRFDTIVLLNRISSIPAKPAALLNIKKLLTENGHLILLLPGHTALYDGSAQAFEAWRRANRTYISSLFGRGILHLKTQFFRISEVEQAQPPGPQDLYDQQVPTFSARDGALFSGTGLFMIAVLKTNINIA
jgi:SAM-dependent methyltransferase